LPSTGVLAHVAGLPVEEATAAALTLWPVAIAALLGRHRLKRRRRPGTTDQ
jgi:hypothetical protein